MSESLIIGLRRQVYLGTLRYYWVCSADFQLTCAATRLLYASVCCVFQVLEQPLVAVLLSRSTGSPKLLAGERSPLELPWAFVQM